MASGFRRQGFKVTSGKAPGKCQTDGPYMQETQRNHNVSVNFKMQQRVQEVQQWGEMTPDKDLETAVLEKNFMFIGCNLPPDDMAPLMYDKQLLTQRENEEFQSMKRGHSSATDKSEHLLGCLLRRQAGSLQLFCDLIDDIPPAKHISERLKEDYKNAQTRRGRLSDSTFIPDNRDRLSKISLSDSDISLRIKDVAPQCTHCKVLERQKKKLDSRCRGLQEKLEELDKEYCRLKENQLKVEVYVEMAKEQFKVSKQENDKLRELVSRLQRDVVQFDTRNSTVDSTLTKLDELMKKNKKTGTINSNNRMLRPYIHRDNSMERFSRSFSDTGELTDDETRYCDSNFRLNQFVSVSGASGVDKTNTSLSSKTQDIAKTKLCPIMTGKGHTDAVAKVSSSKTVTESPVVGLAKPNVKTSLPAVKEHNYVNVPNSRPLVGAKKIKSNELLPTTATTAQTRIRAHHTHSAAKSLGIVHIHGCRPERNGQVLVGHLGAVESSELQAAFKKLRLRDN